MKRIIALLTCLLLTSFAVQASDDKPIDFSQLPKQSQQFIKTYFPGYSVALVKTERDFFDKSYEVIFTNGNKIDFDRSGRWKEVDCTYSQLPEEIIPLEIRNYAAKHFPNIKINQIEKERRSYEISLANDIELTFDLKFNIIDIDR